MIRNRLVLPSLLAVSILAPTLVAQEVPMSRTYEFEILQSDAAKALAWKACSESSHEPCRVASSSDHSLTVQADAATHAKIAAAIAAAEDIPRSQVFQVILLQAENNGDSGLDAVPAQARGALEDARAFLPYSGFKMLGSALLRTDRQASSIVDGPDGNDYRAGLSYENEVGRDGHRLVVRHFSLDRLVSARASSERALESLPVLGTSFTMSPGETVIVGTSKLEGAGRALVVLLTNVQ